MDIPTIEKIVDLLADAGVMSVAFTGGEPFMQAKTLQKGIERVRHYGIDCFVNSNLQILPDEMINLLVDAKVGILTSMLSCIPSIHDKITGRNNSFNRLVRNIQKLNKAGAIVSINTVVRNDTIDTVYQTGLLAHQLGAKRFSATKAAPSPGTDYLSYRANADQVKKSLDILLQLHKETGMRVDILESYPLCFFGDLKKYSIFIRRNCTAGVFNCSISPNGEMRPCSHADIVYGNILEEGIYKCWDRMDDWRKGGLSF